MSFVSKFGVLVFAGLWAVGSAFAQTETPAVARGPLKASILAQTTACKTAVSAAGGLGSTVGDMLEGFQRQTQDDSSAACRWRGTAQENLSVAQLVEAAREVSVEISAGCDPAYECQVARAIEKRADELLAYARTGGVQPALDRYQVHARTVTFGAGAERIDPIRTALAAGPAELSAPWAQGPVGDLNGLVTRLGPAAQSECPACVVRLKRLAPYMPVMFALDAAILPLARTDWLDVQRDAARLSQQWQAYHFGGGWQRTQLPWELLVNGAIYQVMTDKAEREGPLPGGPAAPPNWAVVLAHPSIGVTPFDTHGAESGLVGVVEVLGVGWWSYDEETNQRTNEWGVSIASVYQPRDNGDDWSHGLLVRLPYEGLNIVWTRVELDNGDDEDVFAFSIDVSGLLKIDSLKGLFGLPGG
jgi:hypothetical protein